MAAAWTHNETPEKGTRVQRPTAETITHAPPRAVKEAAFLVWRPLGI
jgi:hypothetical protein